MREFWPRLNEVLRAGHPAFLALVVDHTPGSPGTLGARMFVTDHAPPVGTIGGGAMEFQLLAQARQALAHGAETRLQDLWHREDAPGETSGMICAGRQTNLYHLCVPHRDGPVIEQVAAAVQASRAGMLTIDAGGLQFNDEDVALTRPALRLEREGEAWVYTEQLLNFRRLAILGGGHCGLALSRVMDQLGYDVAVYDRRQGLDTLSRNAHAREQCIVDDYAKAGGMIRYPELTRVVVMTTDYPSDVAALAGVLGRPFPFIGVMGSSAKIDRILGDLRDRGFEESALARLHAPVGLKIHSHTPEEIAISIAAELIREAHGR